MTLLLFTVTAANICLCLAVAGSFTSFDGMIPAALAALVLGAAACACGSLAARKRPLLRFVFLLLPPLALLLTRSAAQAVVLAPALLYPMAVLVSGRFKIAYHDYRTHFIWSGGVVLTLVFIGQVCEISLPPLFFCMASLVLGVFSLRQLRYGELTGWKQKSLEFVSICAFPAGVGLAVVLLPKLVQAGEWLLKSALFPLIQALQKIVEFVIRLFEPVIDSAMEPSETTAVLESTAAATETYVPETVSAEFPVRIRENLPILLIPLGAAAVLFLIFRLVRRLYQTRSAKGLEEREDRKVEADAGNARISAEADWRSNRRKVRRIYEKYLKLLQNRQFHRQPQDSSQEIFEKTRSLSAEEPAQALRELYILARYHPDAAVSDAQVREARRLLRQLREQKQETKSI